MAIDRRLDELAYQAIFEGLKSMPEPPSLSEYDWQVVNRAREEARMESRRDRIRVAGCFLVALGVIPALAEACSS